MYEHVLTYKTRLESIPGHVEVDLCLLYCCFYALEVTNLCSITHYSSSSSSSSQLWVSLSGRGQRRENTLWIAREADVGCVELKYMSSAGGHGKRSDFVLFTFTFIQMEYTFMQNDFQVRLWLRRTVYMRAVKNVSQAPESGTLALCQFLELSLQSFGYYHRLEIREHWFLNPTIDRGFKLLSKALNPIFSSCAISQMILCPALYMWQINRLHLIFIDMILIQK